MNPVMPLRLADMLAADTNSDDSASSGAGDLIDKALERLDEPLDLAASMRTSILSDAALNNQLLVRRKFLTSFFGDNKC